MRSMHLSVAFSLVCLPLAGLIYVFGRLEGKRMVAADAGWEMAFYWSPLVFLAIDAVLIVGAVAGLVGLAFESRQTGRMQAAVAGLVCIGSFLALPWR